MPLVQYVGHKARKDDNVGKSGVVWFGHGDVQEVPARAWGALSRHPDVWQLVDDGQSGEAEQADLDVEEDAEKPAAFANMSMHNPEDLDDEPGNVVARPEAIPTPPGVNKQVLQQRAKGRRG